MADSYGYTFKHPIVVLLPTTDGVILEVEDNSIPWTLWSESHPYNQDIRQKRLKIKIQNLTEICRK
ncbi:hypothetical protein HZS_1712 [Henneguya salminicola]|nr:hypothetical protein HZS_1712 [Henneguya salminicola]